MILREARELARSEKRQALESERLELPSDLLGVGRRAALEVHADSSVFDLDQRADTLAGREGAYEAHMVQGEKGAASKGKMQMKG